MAAKIDFDRIIANITGIIGANNGNIFDIAANNANINANIDAITTAIDVNIANNGTKNISCSIKIIIT